MRVGACGAQRVVVVCVALWGTVSYASENMEVCENGKNRLFASTRGNVGRLRQGNPFSRPEGLGSVAAMSTAQLDGVREGASACRARAIDHARSRPSLPPSLAPVSWLTCFDVAGGDKPKASAAGTDGGWAHSTPLKTRYASPTGLMSFDGESAWNQYDPHIVVPKEWGKQTENWKGSLRDCTGRPDRRTQTTSDSRVT